VSDLLLRYTIIAILSLGLISSVSVSSAAEKERTGEVKSTTQFTKTLSIQLGEYGNPILPSPVDGPRKSRL
jgi:hypothetical protein